MPENKNFNALSAEDQLLVMQAVDILCSEPDIAAKLTKLAAIKTDKPIMWKMVIAKL